MNTPDQIPGINPTSKATRDSSNALAEDPVPRLSGLLRRRIAGAFSYSLDGLSRGWFEEAFRVEAVLAMFLVPLGMWLGQTGLERVALVAPIALVLIIELLNTAIEEIVDRISIERHPRSKHAKDLGSAAVFVAMMLVLFSWASILLGR
ncbi:MAG: diacylglycerol kinase [Burkholderiaceae bacterium]